MTMKSYQKGFSLVELMVASLLGLIVSYSVLNMYLAQSQLYKASHSQTFIFSTENALVNLINPVIRSAGFLGCSATSTGVSALNSGGPNPLGNFNTTPTMVYGNNGSGSTLTVTGSNPANSNNANDWSPALDASLVGQVQKNSDVLILLGAPPSTSPIGITQIIPTSASFSVQSTSGFALASGQFGAVSDCVKSVVFQITGISGSTITHNAGAGTLQNTNAVFPVSFQPGAQFIPLQQVAFFVGQGHGGQSALMRATLSGGAWTIEPLVPGVELMKVQYGIGTNGSVTQYVRANAVPDWSKVYSIRMGFLIAGKLGSGHTNTTNYSVLDTAVTIPSDNRLRHVYEMTVQLRNAI